jgi:hypothetical protein
MHTHIRTMHSKQQRGNEGALNPAVSQAKQHACSQALTFHSHVCPPPSHGSHGSRGCRVGAVNFRLPTLPLLRCGSRESSGHGRGRGGLGPHHAASGRQLKCLHLRGPGRHNVLDVIRYTGCMQNINIAAFILIQSVYKSMYRSKHGHKRKLLQIQSTPIGVYHSLIADTARGTPGPAAD